PRGGRGIRRRRRPGYEARCGGSGWSSWNLVRLMWGVAFSAFATRIMVPGIDLLEPFGPGRVLLVTAHAMAEGQLGNFDVRVVRMRAAGSVTGFAGDRFVLELQELLVDVRVALVAGAAAGE